jgi:hypothetical protein
MESIAEVTLFNKNWYDSLFVDLMVNLLVLRTKEPFVTLADAIDTYGTRTPC